MKKKPIKGLKRGKKRGITDLSVTDGKAVRGGGTAKKPPQTYFVVTLEDAKITSFNTTP